MKAHEKLMYETDRKELFSLFNKVIKHELVKDDGSHYY
jgi:hypothetical protein